MNSKSINNNYEYDNNEQYNNNEGYENNEQLENSQGYDNNYNYDNNQNFGNADNNYYNYNNNYNNQYNNYNNPYGNILQYYNNYPIYATIPASIKNENQEEQNNEYQSIDAPALKGKTELKPEEPKRAIILNIDPKNICHARPPQYSPAFIGMPPGMPAYAFKPPKQDN